MRKFEILEHISDLKIKAFGKDKKELFENAMIGMFEGAGCKEISNSENIEREIKIYAHDLSSLLVDFLSEVLYLSEVRQEVYKGVKFKKFQEDTTKINSARFSLEAVLTGKKLKNKSLIIKGVTYHELKISQLKDGSWETVILFDI